MPTNKERREVARKLREKHEKNRSEMAGMVVPQSMGMVAMNLLEDLESCLPDHNTSLIAIADLIEPEPDRTCFIVENDEGYSSCSVCGAQYLCMTCASYCPDCGSKVVEYAD